MSKPGTFSVREKSSLSKRDSKNPQWKGDEVGYVALHHWVRCRFPHEGRCQACGISCNPDLANISQEYKRDLTDWEWLCRRCHMVKDGRMETLNNRAKERKRLLVPLQCKVCHEVFRPLRPKQSHCSLSCGRTTSNKKRKPLSSSGMKGVSWHLSNKRWVVRIKVDGKNRYVGSSKNLKEAARMYNTKAIEVHGFSTYLNPL